MSAPTRIARSRRRLCHADRDLRAGRELFHRQRLLAEHAGTAQSSAGPHPRRSPGAGARGARPRARRSAGDTPVLLKIAPDLEPRRARRRRACRALAPGRRHDRRQHHDGAAVDLARSVARERAGRPVGPAAVPAVDADAGGDLRARRRRVSADRRRRHRFRRRGADQDPRRREPGAALFAAGLSRGSGWSRRSRPISLAALRTATMRCRESSARCRRDHRRTGRRPNDRPRRQLPARPVEASRPRDHCWTYRPNRDAPRWQTPALSYLVGGASKRSISVRAARRTAATAARSGSRSRRRAGSSATAS